jgi:hypothetical protein
MKPFTFTAVLIGTAAIASGVTAAIALAGSSGAAPGAVSRAAVAPRSAPTYQPDFETHYVPVRPCRIVDTRIAGGKLGDGAQRAFYVTGSTGFSGQGGHSGGCGVPAGATGVTVNLLSLGATHTGFMRAWPNGSSQPTAVVLAYLKTATESGAASLAIQSSEPSLRVGNFQAKTNLTIDVTGYYVKPLAGFISPSGTPYSGSSRIINAAHPATGVFEVQFDRNIRYCSATATPYVSSYYASVSTWFDSTRPDTVRVWVWDATGAAADQYFYINVEC